MIRKYVEGQLTKSPYMHDNICIHGFKTCIKGRTLKRRSTIVKHSRFLRNLEVYPIVPPEPIIVVEEEALEGENNEEEDE